MLTNGIHPCSPPILLPWLQVATSTQGGGGRPAAIPGSSTCGDPHGKHMGGWGSGGGSLYRPSPSLPLMPSMQHH